MNIDWTSLGLVSVVTVVATVLIVSVVSGGALMLDRAHARAEAGSDGAAGLVALGWTAIGVAGLIVLYGYTCLSRIFTDVKCGSCRTVRRPAFFMVGRGRLRMS